VCRYERDKYLRKRAESKNTCADCGASIMEESTRCHTCHLKQMRGKKEVQEKLLYWEEDEIEVLKHYYPIGGPDLAAQYIDRSIASIASKAFLMGIVTNRVLPRPAREVLYNAYHILGLSTNGLAKKFGVSKGTIYNWMNEFNIPTRSFSEVNGFNMLGKCHSEETKKKMSISRRYLMKDGVMIKRAPSDKEGKSRYRTGKRDDLGGLFVRSSWEANYARFLKWLKQHGEIINWEYEPDTFWFEGIKKGTYTYTPDFKITNKDGTVEYHEIKGHWTSKGRTQVKRMKKYYPEITLKIIDGDVYKALVKDCKNLIPGWE